MVNSWASTARLRKSNSQWAAPVTELKAAGTIMALAPGLGHQKKQLGKPDVEAKTESESTEFGIEQCDLIAGTQGV